MLPSQVKVAEKQFEINKESENRSFAYFKEKNIIPKVHNFNLEMKEN